MPQQPSIVLLVALLMALLSGCKPIPPPISAIPTPTKEASVVKRLALGATHTCVINSDAEVLCWGDNEWGQLGDGTTESNLIPTLLSGLGSGAIAIASEELYTCALTNDGKVFCWGGNEMGDITYPPLDSRLTPTPIGGLPTNIVDLAVGRAHACALDADGSIICWGKNDKGQLGDGTTTDSTVPMHVVDAPDNIISIDAGYANTCALTSDGNVYCWGDNKLGQIGDGTLEPRLTPTLATRLPGNIAAITVQQDHSCALSENGAVYCWGLSLFGEAEEINTNDDPKVSPVEGLPKDIIAITAGGTHNCALTGGDNIYCWGNNMMNQLGDSTDLVSQLDVASDEWKESIKKPPVQVINLPYDIVLVAAGLAHTCALTESEEIFCWGWNAGRQLGDRTTMTRPTPTRVLLP